MLSIDGKRRPLAVFGNHWEIVKYIEQNGGRIKDRLTGTLVKLADSDLSSVAAAPDGGEFVEQFLTNRRHGVGEIPWRRKSWIKKKSGPGRLVSS